MNSRVRNVLAILIVVLVAAGAYAAWALTRPPPQPVVLDHVKVGTIGGGTIGLIGSYYYPIWVARDRGFWKENGIEIEWIPFASGSDMQKALASGQLQLTFSTVTTALGAIAAGAPIKLIGVELRPPDQTFVVPTNSPIKSPQDLKGKTFGVTSIGSLSYITVLLMAKYYGWGPKDITIVPLGTYQALLGSLLQGKIDTFSYSISTHAPLIERGQIRALVSAKEFIKEWFDQGLVASDDLIKSNPDLVRRFLRAVYESIDYMYKNSDYSIKNFAMVDNMSQTAAKITLDNTALDRNGTIRWNELQAVINAMVSVGSLKSPLTPEQTYTNQFIPAGGWSTQFSIQADLAFSSMAVTAEPAHGQWRAGSIEPLLAKSSD